MTTSLLRITDGTTTKNFSSGDSIKLIKYIPAVAQAFGKPVTDEIEVHFVAATASDNRTAIQVVNQLLEQARNYAATETGARVYLEFDPGSTGTYYRSQISNGRIELGEGAIGWDFEINRFRVTIQVTRDPFWEGALTAVPLTNNSDTDNTTGIDVDNASAEIVGANITWDDDTVIQWDDSSTIEWDTAGSGTGEGDNWVAIDGADIAGDLPAPLKVSVENNSSGSAAMKELYLFHNVFSNPSSLSHMLEGEAAAGSGVTISADTSCQNGAKAAIAWTATSETLIAEWNISGELATYAAGGRFALLARWVGAFPYTNCWLRVKLTTINDNVLWSGNLNIVSSTRELALLDVLRLPPYLQNQTSIKDIKLKLYGLRNTAGTHTITLDYIQLSPISGDSGWKRFLSVDNGCDYGEALIHDATESFTYKEDTTNRLISEFTDYGGPILMIPGRAQRLYFNACDENGTAAIAQNLLVKLWYRPRRSSL